MWDGYGKSLVGAIEERWEAGTMSRGRKLRWEKWEIVTEAGSAEGSAEERKVGATRVVVESLAGAISGVQQLYEEVHWDAEICSAGKYDEIAGGKVREQQVLMGSTRRRHGPGIRAVGGARMDFGRAAVVDVRGARKV